MDKKVQSVADLIDKLGGPTATGRTLDATPQMVVGWRERGAIPSRRYFIHKEKLDSLGIIAPATIWSFDFDDRGEASAA